jgi:hypothetical protein
MRAPGLAREAWRPPQEPGRRVRCARPKRVGAQTYLDEGNTHDGRDEDESGLRIKGLGQKGMSSSNSSLREPPPADSSA